MKPLFVTPDNMAMVTDLYELTMAAAYHDNRQTHEGIFELFARHLPKNRSYVIAAGLEQAIDYLRNLRFREEHVEYLRRHPIFKDVSPEFFNYLRTFHFTGDVWAVPEGTVLFPNEPILRVSAPIIEAQVAETFLLSTINFQTLIATKASRIVQAARGRGIVEFGARRAHGPGASLLAARAAYVGGCVGTSNVIAGFLLGIPIYGTIAHSYVLNFDSEIEAFKEYCRVFPKNSTLLVDTYDTIQGVRNAMAVGIKPVAIRLDSGDLLALSRKARRLLDGAGFTDTKIFASGDMNEYLIDRLVKRGAPIDSFGVGTELSTSRDDPALPGIYKLVALKKGDQIVYKMKLSKGKKTLPGPKQIFRVYGKGGMLRYDILTLEDEAMPQGAVPMMAKVMERGEVTRELPNVDDIRRYAADQLDKLPGTYKALNRVAKAPVKLSKRLMELSG